MLTAVRLGNIGFLLHSTGALAFASVVNLTFGDARLVIEIPGKVNYDILFLFQSFGNLYLFLFSLTTPIPQITMQFVANEMTKFVRVLG